MFATINLLASGVHIIVIFLLWRKLLRSTLLEKFQICNAVSLILVIVLYSQPQDRFILYLEVYIFKIPFFYCSVWLFSFRCFWKFGLSGNRHSYELYLLLVDPIFFQEIWLESWQSSTSLFRIFPQLVQILGLFLLSSKSWRSQVPRLAAKKIK